MLMSVFEELPLLTILPSDLGSAVVIPIDKRQARISFSELLLTKLPTQLQLEILQKKLVGRGITSSSCDFQNSRLSVAVCVRIPRLFPNRRVLRRAKSILDTILKWAEPLTLIIKDEFLGNLRWRAPDYEGKLQQGQTPMITDLWIDLFIESSEQPNETDENIARLRQLVVSWEEVEPKIKAEIMRTIFPEYQQLCVERKDKFRHDEVEFWKELSVVSLAAKLDKSIVVRYHCGELFGSCRVEASIANGEIDCSVKY